MVSGARKVYNYLGWLIHKYNGTRKVTNYHNTKRGIVFFSPEPYPSRFMQGDGGIRILGGPVSFSCCRDDTVVTFTGVLNSAIFICKFKYFTSFFEILQEVPTLSPNSLEFNQEALFSHDNNSFNLLSHRKVFCDDERNRFSSTTFESKNIQ